jgi:nucleoside-diphosphate-sugar epimerase
MMKVMITGGMGLIGAGLKEALNEIGVSVEVLDLRGVASEGTFGDVCDIETLSSRMHDCDGVVHLAAVSRVIWGEKDPVACWATNVDGTSNVLSAALEARNGRLPWVIYASSREVYGRQDRLPVSEDTELRPINVYGRSKVAAEALTIKARAAGLATAVVRFSNVFGSTGDHRDRVVPAFARAAATGGTMRIEGGEHVFDFTWRDDVCKGLVSLCRLMEDETVGPPPIQFVTGRGTTLAELAELACAYGRPETRVEHFAPRAFDVETFRGEPQRAEELLGWRAETDVETGVARLVEAFKAEFARAEKADTALSPAC